MLKEVSRTDEKWGRRQGSIRDPCPPSRDVHHSGQTHATCINYSFQFHLCIQFVWFLWTVHIQITCTHELRVSLVEHKVSRGMNRTWKEIYFTGQHRG
jgi:hypothetical protein